MYSKLFSAVMALVLFFVPDPAVGLAEMKRVVQPGGTVAAYVWDIYDGGLPIEEFHSEFRSLGIEYPLPPSAEVSKLEVLENLWKTANLHSIESKRIYVERTFDNFEDYWEVNAFSMLGELNLDTVEIIKSSIKKKVSAQSSDERVVIRGHANAIKGIV